jgi:two-component system alkaline phosphatase synthesis response regulator PhoP
MATRILVVDDEPAVRGLLDYNLRKAGYETQLAGDGREALRLALQTRPDLILLDLMLPELDGLEVCQELRKTLAIPIIMITARGEEIDRVVGLELGADDYVAKPFSVRELLARIKAVLRRSPSIPGQSGLPLKTIQGKGGLVIDLESRQARVGDRPVELTRLEFDLLCLLLARPGRVFTREQLLEEVWGYAFSGDTRAVDSAVKRLRSRLRAANLEADAIEAVRGLGYRFDLDGDR